MVPVPLYLPRPPLNRHRSCGLDLHPVPAKAIQSPIHLFPSLLFPTADPLAADGREGGASAPAERLHERAGQGRAGRGGGQGQEDENHRALSGLPGRRNRQSQR